MPKKLERKLEKEAKALGYTNGKKDAYVYGTMRKTGWVPSTQKHTNKPVKKRGRGG